MPKQKQPKGPPPRPDTTAWEEPEVGTLPGLSREASLIIGGLLAILNGIVSVAGLGGFEDGLQWADLVPILGPLVGAILVRQNVFSRETVERLGARAGERL